MHINFYSVLVCLFDLILQSFSCIGMGLPELNHKLARINVSCSRTQHSDTGEAQTRAPSVLSILSSFCGVNPGVLSGLIII